MKKAISLLLTLMLIAFSTMCFTGCDSKDERALREAREELEDAQRDAQRAKDEYDDIKEQADDYLNARDRLHDY